MSSTVDDLPELFAKMDDALEDSSASVLGAMVEASENTRCQLATNKQNVKDMILETIPSTLRQLAKLKQQNDRLSKGTNKTLKRWNTRNLEVWGEDAVSAALQKQLEEAQATLLMLEENVHGLEAQVELLKTMSGELQTAIELKSQAMDVDKAALQVTADTSSSPSKWQPNSPIKQNEWEKTNCDLFEKTTAAIEETGLVCETAAEMQAERMGVQRQSFDETLEALEAKVCEWQGVLEDLKTQVEAEVDRIAKLVEAMEQLAARRKMLQKRTVQAETRLAERNSRPMPERKADEAEDSLLAEVQKFIDLDNELAVAEEGLQGELQEAKDALENIQKKIPDAAAAQRIDQDCLILEREQKQLFEVNRVYLPGLQLCNF